MSIPAKKHWCKSYNPKPNTNGNCGDCHNYDTAKGYCPKNFAASTDLVHPPVKPRGRSKRVTGVLR